MFNRSLPVPEEGLDRRYVLSLLRKRTRVRIALPLIPLIDITFQLLLYFMLTSNFADPERQLTGFLPTNGGSTSILLPIHVTIEPVGPTNGSAQYRINKEMPTQDVEKVYAALAARVRSTADTEIPVVIHADQEVRWAYVIEVFNAASSAGFTAVTFEAVSSKQ